MATTNRLVRYSELVRLTGRSRSSIRRDIKLGKFPRPVAVGRRAVAWRLSDIDEWMQNLPTVGVEGAC